MSRDRYNTACNTSSHGRPEVNGWAPSNVCFEYHHVPCSVRKLAPKRLQLDATTRPRGRQYTEEASSMDGTYTYQL